MIPAWAYDARIYHVYPLGLTDSPKFNPFTDETVPRLEQLYAWIDHIIALNLNTVCLGPVFDSTEHGYNVADYFKVDRRLGDNATLKSLISTMKERGLKVILDGVFIHVGRDFWAFKDIQEKRDQSAYTDWFYLDFDATSPFGDSFAYEGWQGHYDLVKLNQDHPQVRAHLFDAVAMWIREFDIDGFRIPGIDIYSPDFVRALATHCRGLKSDFWLLGEVRGDYHDWANPHMLDSAVDFAFYEALDTSHAQLDYTKLSDVLHHQFGVDGAYRDLLLYGFADNLDTNRIASRIPHTAQLYPLYLLLFTSPSLPSIYYGSEWGLLGERIKEEENYENQNVDNTLRPAIQLNKTHTFPRQDLPKHIAQFASLRAQLPALRHGDYQTRFVSGSQFAFSRTKDNQMVIVAVNADDIAHYIHLTGLDGTSQLTDQLTGETVLVVNGGSDVAIPAYGGRVLVGLQK